uniref:Uncharacterized protein n=1 Tax=Taeniopygia guttata TaxID=59729 RepID=H0ZDS2_TAEGU
MSSEGFLKEVQAIGEKFLLKLQKLPKAEPVEIVSFSYLFSSGNGKIPPAALCGDGMEGITTGSRTAGARRMKFVYTMGK